jgi:2-methylcitrate dehydratase PrpD
MASSVLANHVALTELTDAFVQRRDVQELMGRVKVDTNTDYDPDQPGASVADQVVVRLCTGDELLSERVARARGHAEKPLREDELFAKFENCLQAGQSTVLPVALFERLQAIDSSSARSITSMH